MVLAYTREHLHLLALWSTIVMLWSGQRTYTFRLQVPESPVTMPSMQSHMPSVAIKIHIWAAEAPTSSASGSSNSQDGTSLCGFSGLDHLTEWSGPSEQ